MRVLLGIVGAILAFFAGFIACTLYLQKKVKDLQKAGTKIVEQVGTAVEGVSFQQKKSEIPDIKELDPEKWREATEGTVKYKFQKFGETCFVKVGRKSPVQMPLSEVSGYVLKFGV